MTPKPETYTFSELVVEPLMEFTRTLFALFGYWYCDHCEVYHGPLVKRRREIKFTKLPELIEENHYCSLYEGEIR